LCGQEKTGFLLRRQPVHTILQLSEIVNDGGADPVVEIDSVEGDLELVERLPLRNDVPRGESNGQGRLVRRQEARQRKEDGSEKEGGKKVDGKKPCRPAEPFHPVGKNGKGRENEDGGKDLEKPGEGKKKRQFPQGLQVREERRDDHDGDEHSGLDHHGPPPASRREIPRCRPFRPGSEPNAD